MTEVVRGSLDRNEIDAQIGGMVLKRLGPDDAETVRELVMYDPDHFWKVGEIMPKHCATVETTRQWIAGKTRSGLLDGGNKFGMYAAGEMVGCTGYRVKDSKTAEIWYWVGAQHGGQGHAPDAIRTLLSFLFQDGFSAATARTRLDNARSRRVLRKEGFVEYGIYDGFAQNIIYAA